MGIGKINELESLILVAEGAAKVDALNELAFEVRNTDTPRAIVLCQDAQKICLGINYPIGNATALNNEAFCNVQLSEYELALEKLFEALSIFTEQDFEKGIAQVNYNLTLISFRFSDFSSALDYINKALAFYQKLNDISEMARCYFQLGFLYIALKDSTSAIEYLSKSLSLSREVKNQAAGAAAIMGLGQAYLARKEYERSEEYLMESMSIREQIKDWRGYAASLNAYMTLCLETGRDKEAEEIARKGIEIASGLGDKMGISRFMVDLGKIYLQQNKTEDAERTLQEALTTAEKIKLRMSLAPAHFSLSEIYEKKSDYKTALKHFKQYYKEMEELLNTDATMKARSIRLTGQIENAQKEAEINHLKNVELKNAYSIIEEKNKDITASITYAKRIQQAKLPDKKNITAALPQCFILFKPKDIVSGDFYFFYKTESTVFIAAVDCTGHGVPGVIMSMIGSEKLYEAVTHIEGTSEILQRVNSGIKAALRQSDNDQSTRDGMDIALCALDVDNCILRYAGANRPLWLIRKKQNELEEIKATKKAIGGFTDSGQHFDSHELKLKKGDTFYIFSDGYADTFGGEKGKKLTVKKFKEIVIGIQNKSMPEQEKYLDDFIELWKGGIEQVDDILVIGVRV